MRSFKMLEEKKVKINVPLKEAEIDPEGLREVDKTLMKFGIFLDFNFIIDKISPNWVITKGEIAGTFPKRLAKICKQQWGIVLNSDILGKVGEIARKYTLNREYFIEFSRDFNWTPGEFGDKGSCFFDVSSYQRTRIKLLGGYAMKVYNEDESPLGRAWVLPYDKNERNFLVFNSYNTRNYTLIFFARLLAIHLGGIYEMIPEVIPGIYTNKEYFYFISSEGIEFSLIEFEKYLDNNLVFCPSCNKFFPVLKLWVRTHDTRLLCPLCYETLAGEEENV
jgi:hypothetical protein